MPESHPALPSGRCARCHCNTGTYGEQCESCDKWNKDPGTCLTCHGLRQVAPFLSECCGEPLVDEAAAVDRAYELAREEGWSR